MCVPDPHLRRPRRRPGAARAGSVPGDINAAVAKADALRRQAIERAREGTVIHGRPHPLGGVRIERGVGRGIAIQDRPDQRLLRNLDDRRLHVNRRGRQHRPGKSGCGCGGSHSGWRLDARGGCRRRRGGRDIRERRQSLGHADGRRSGIRLLPFAVRLRRRDVARDWRF